jgi:hypothetical protein
MPKSGKFWDKERSEVIKNYAQMFAVVIAAGWTLYLFFQREKPFLEQRAEITSDRKWQNIRSKDQCRAVFDVEFVNTGTRSIDIAKALVRVWRFELPGSQDKDATYVDLDTIQHEKPFDQFEVVADPDDPDSSHPFVEHHPPGAKFHHAFEWIVNPGHVSAPSGTINAVRRWYVRLDLYNSLDSKQSSWHTGNWAPICNQE